MSGKQVMVCKVYEAYEGQKSCFFLRRRSSANQHCANPRAKKGNTSKHHTNHCRNGPRKNREISSHIVRSHSMREIVAKKEKMCHRPNGRSIVHFLVTPSFCDGSSDPSYVAI